MNVDKALFLALATTLSTVACSAATEEDKTGDAQGAATGANAYCWDPAVESVGTPSTNYFSSEIGFDPVKDYPAAESFCIDLAYNVEAAPGDVIMDGEMGSLYYKCEAYAKLYVPYTTYVAFMSLKENASAKSTPRKKWDAMYNLDRDIEAMSVCRTDAAKATCRPTSKADCEIVAAQLKTEWQGSFFDCQANRGYTVHSCVEGVLSSIGPTSTDSAH